MSERDAVHAPGKMRLKDVAVWVGAVVLCVGAVLGLSAFSTAFALQGWGLLATSALAVLFAALGLCALFFLPERMAERRRHRTE